jgi:hypothetical protein
MYEKSKTLVRCHLQLLPELDKLVPEIVVLLDLFGALVALLLQAVIDLRHRRLEARRELLALLRIV